MVGDGVHRVRHRRLLTAGRGLADHGRMPTELPLDALEMPLRVRDRAGEASPASSNIQTLARNTPRFDTSNGSPIAKTLRFGSATVRRARVDIWVRGRWSRATVHKGKRPGPMIEIHGNRRESITYNLQVTI